MISATIGAPPAHRFGSRHIQARFTSYIPERICKFASHLLLANYEIQTIQKLLGHGDTRNTMIYLQTVPSVTLKEARSPMDLAG